MKKEINNNNEYANTTKNDRKVEMQGMHGIASAVYIHGVANALTPDKTQFELRKFEVALKLKNGGKVVPLGVVMHSRGIKTASPSMTMERARIWERYLLGKNDYETYKNEMKAEAAREKELKEIAKQLKEADSKKDSKKGNK